MARSPEKSSPAAKPDGFRKRGNPLTDYHDASEPLYPHGFGEAPQPELSGTPLSGSVSDWAAQIEREAEAVSKARQGRPAGAPDGTPSRSEPQSGDSVSAKKKKIPERSSAPTKTARGTSMGGAATARERAAAGLNPDSRPGHQPRRRRGDAESRASPPRSRLCRR